MVVQSVSLTSSSVCLGRLLRTGESFNAFALKKKLSGRKNCNNWQYAFSNGRRGATEAVLLSRKRKLETKNGEEYLNMPMRFPAFTPNLHQKLRLVQGLHCMLAKICCLS